MNEKSSRECPGRLKCSPTIPWGGGGGGEERCLDKYICSIVLIVNYPDMDYEEMKAEPGFGDEGAVEEEGGGGGGGD